MHCQTMELRCNGKGSSELAGLIPQKRPVDTDSAMLGSGFTLEYLLIIIAIVCGSRKEQQIMQSLAVFLPISTANAKYVIRFAKSPKRHRFLILDNVRDYWDRSDHSILVGNQTSQRVCLLGLN